VKAVANHYAIFGEFFVIIVLCFSVIDKIAVFVERAAACVGVRR
jgi:hypothetical protein